MTSLQRLEDRTLLASVTVSFQNGVSNYSGTTDSRILGDNVTRNDGNNSALQAHGYPDRAALIRWDVSSIAAGSIVESASITLNVLDKSSQAYELYALLKPWVENQVSWNITATGSNWATAGAQGATDRNSTPLGSITALGTGVVTVQLNAEGLTRIQSWINTPGSNNGIIIQDYANTDGLEISSSEAVTVSTRPKLTITYATSTTPPVNQPPIANPNTYSVNRGATLNANDTNGSTGTTNDDSVVRNDTDPENNVLTATVVTGPTHATTFTLNTNGTFTYVHNNDAAVSDSFTYRVSDGTNFSNTVTVTINIVSPPPVNQPPNVSAGADQSFLFPNIVPLDGTVSDDGLPNPPAALTTTWSKISGPGTVTFASASSVDTTATFSAPGTYVLRLTANDLALSQFDEVTVTVNPALVGVTTVTFQNGVDGYNGMIDSRIRFDNPARNDGALTTMQSHGNPDRASLLRWDLSSIQPGAVVDSASITLNIIEKTNQAYELYALLKPWIENQATWNQAATGANWSIAGALGASDRGSAVLASLTAPATGLVTIQLNAAGITQLQNWINNPVTNNGFIIQDYGATDGVEMSSSEAANVSIRPKLSITIAEDRTPKLQKIVEGLNLYQDTFGELPVDEIPALYESANSPFLSWRVHILPFIGYGDLYQQFHLDEAWDSPHNLTLLNQMPDVFRSRGLLPGTNQSGFRMFQGNGAFEYGKSILPAFNGTYDAAEHTLLVLETMAQNADFWTRPDEIQFNPANPLGSLTLPNDAFLVATLDGQIKQVKRTVSAQTFSAFTTWDGNEVLSAAQYNELYVGWDAVDSAAASKQKLRELNLAMYAFNDTHLAFPPGNNIPADWIDPVTGKPFLSWRVHLLSVMGYHDLYAQFRFNEPWNSAHNIQLLDKMPAEFRSRGLAAGSTASAFKLITGPEAYLVDAVAPNLGGPRLNDVRDGVPSTLQIIELTPDKAVPWTQWNEIDFSSANPLAGIGPIPAGGLQAVLYDGNVHTINPAALGENFKIFATDNGSETFTTAQAANVFLDWPLPDTVEYRSQKMRDLALAFHNYHDVYSNFPVDGLAANWDAVNNRPKLSWRVYLLPFIGYEDLYHEFHLDEAWDSPHNIQLLDKMPEIYRTRGLPGNSHLTAVKLFIDETAYRYRTFSDGSGAGPRYSDILDGTLNTIAAIELMPDQAVEWTRADGDIDFNPADALAGVGTIPTDGLLVTLFDGIVKTINPAVTAENFSKFVTSRSGEIFGPAETSNVFLDWQKPSPTSYSYAQNPLRQERLYSSVKLKQLMIGFLNYEDIYNYFPIDYDPDNWDMTASTPTSGVPNLSWRVHILPFIEYGSLYEQFHLDEAWDSPHNIQLVDKMPEIFRSRGLPGDSTKSGFKLFMGEGAYEFNPTTLPNEPSYVGPRQFQLEDGSSNTIAIIETAPEDAMEWTRPDSDIAWNPADPYGGLTIPPDYFLAAMFDGSIRNLNPLLDEAILRALVTWDGGEIITYPDE